MDTNTQIQTLIDNGTITQDLGDVLFALQTQITLYHPPK